jgi:hypothetical protein
MSARPFKWPLSTSCHGGAKPPPLKPPKPPEKPKD